MSKPSSPEPVATLRHEATVVVLPLTVNASPALLPIRFRRTMLWLPAEGRIVETKVDARALECVG